MQGSIPLMVAGTFLKSIGGLSAASQNSAALNMQMQEERLLGMDEQERIREAARAAMGRQLASQGETGFATGTGSALNAIQESFINRELDILTSRRNTAGRVAAMQYQKKTMMQQAQMNVLSEAIGAAGQIANYRAQYDRAGEVPYGI